MTFPFPFDQHRHENGSAVLVLLGLLSIAAILTVSDHMALRHLFGELKRIETQQRKKYTPPSQPALPPRTNSVAQARSSAIFPSARTGEGLHDLGFDAAPRNR